MALTIETGAGIRAANAFVPIAFVTAYLTARGRGTAWSALSTAEQEAAILAATDYISIRWGQRFRGTREFSFDEVTARGLVAFSGLPSDAEELTIGEQTYTFVTFLSGAADEVLIGADAAATASNLGGAVDAIVGGAGVTYGTGTQINRSASASTVSAEVTLHAKADGLGGNYTVLSGTPTNVTLTAFSGGLNGGSQPLPFPRVGLYDDAGLAVLGVPQAIRDATAEYADRARVALLAPDPAVDDRGAVITKLREKVGPIETETVYEAGSHLRNLLRPYPAADRLLAPYLTPAGRAIR
jgi:hypothetical protein